MLAVLVVTLTVLVPAVQAARSDALDSGLEWLPLLESAVNDLVFAAIAIWFLYSVPDRLHRDGLLELLHRLRSMAHIVDMHQLTKDPGPGRNRRRTARVASTGKVTITLPRLARGAHRLRAYVAGESCRAAMSSLVVLRVRR